MDITLSRFAQVILAATDSILGKQRGPGVLAVSGGADSVAMRRAFGESTRSARIVIAHFNHGLRGKESDEDAAFVQSIAQPDLFRLGSVDIAALAAETGENIEALARRRRYEFLAKVARETGAEWIATAHTADDQAETVLHRMLRGSGVRGLRGIALSRPLEPGIVLIRPMLELTRMDVIAYLKESGQCWREDSSNQDHTFTRNRIRHELIPLLRTFNPQLHRSLGRLAEQADEVCESIDRITGEQLAKAELPRAGQIIVLKRESLCELRDSDVRNVFRSLWERENWPMGAMTRDHWLRTVQVTRGELTSSDMPDGITIRRAGGVVRIGPRESDS